MLKNYLDKIKYGLLISLTALSFYTQQGITQQSQEQKSKKDNLELTLGFGTSSNKGNPFNGSFGVYSKHLKLYDGFNLKLLLGEIIFEKTSSSLKSGIGLEKRLGDYSIEMDAGISMIKPHDPIHVSEGEVREPLPEFGLFTDLILKRKISNKINCFLKLGKNYSSEELNEKRDYPKYRISVGLSLYD